MDLKAGEKILGTVQKITSEQYIISLREGKKGTAPKDGNNGIDEESIAPGTQLYVRVQSSNSSGQFSLAIDGVVDEEQFTDCSEQFVNEVEPQRIKEKYGTHTNNSLKESLNQWFHQAENTLQKINQHRSKRLDEDFYNN